MTNRRLRLVRLLAVLAGAACADSGGPSDVLVVSSVTISPSGGSLIVGQVLQLTATARTSSGITVPDRAVTWSSGNPAVASVSGTGLVTGVTIGGPVTITATIDGRSGVISVTITPIPVGSVTVDPPASAILVGGAVQLTATVRGDQGQILNGRPVAWNSSAPGTATVTTQGMVVGIAAGGPVSITATSEGKAGSAQVTVGARPASRLGFLTHPPNGVAGQVLAPAVRVAVQDDIGNTVAGATTSISVALNTNPGGASLGGTTTVNAVDGVATFPTLVLDKSAAGYVLGASAVALTPTISNPFTIAGAAAAALTITTQPSAAATSGAVFARQPVLQLRDALGNPAAQAGVSVTATLASGAGTLGGTTTLVSNASGVVTFTNLTITGPSGPYTLRFTGTGLTAVVSEVVTLGAGTATQLALVTQPSPTGQSGVGLATQPVVELRDGSGNPVTQAGVAIAVAVSAPGVLGGAATVATDASGRANFAGLSIAGVAGAYTMTFSSTGLTGVTSNPITLSAGAATRLAMVTQPSAAATVGVVLPTQPSVRLQDGNGNPVSQAGVVVTVTFGSGAGVLGGTATAATNASGIATFAGLLITGTVGPYTLNFAAPGLIAVTSDVVLLGVGSATGLVIAVPPSSSASSGVPFPIQPGIQVIDAGGNPVSQSGTTVTAALLSGPGTLGGTLTAVTNGSGRATFTNLAITGGAGTYTIGFSAPGLGGVTSGIIGLGAGVATQLTITTQPSAAAQSGVTFGTQPVIQLRDGSSNVVAQAGVTVTATITAPGTGTLGVTVAVATDAGGVATFADLQIVGLVGARTLTFTATGLAPAVSGTITLSAGPATTLAANSSVNQTATVANVVAAAPSVLVTDGGGNPVAGHNVTFAVAAGGGAIVPVGAAVVATDVNGIATLTSWTLGTVAGTGNNSVTATAAGLTGSPVTFVATATADVATTIVANSVTSQSAPISTAVAAPPSVLVTDTHGNPILGTNVTFTLTPDGTGGSIAPASPAVIATDAAGTATLTTWTLGSVSGTNNNTVTATATGLAGSPVTFNASGTVGAATTIAANSAINQSATVATAVAAAPSVVVTDGGGNPVSGVNVTFAVASGGGTIAPAGPAVVATDVNGLATLTSWTLGTVAGVGNNSVTATSGGLTGSPVTFTATATADVATTITANSSTSQSGTISSVVAAPPSVLVTDTHGNPVAGTGVTFTLTADGTGGSIVPASPAVTATDAAGVATLTTWTIGSDAGVNNNTVTAAAAGLAGSPVTFNASGFAGSATTIAANSSTSQSATVGTMVAAVPTVLVTDLGGNPVGGVPVAFAVTAGGGSTVPASPTIVVTDGSGLAALTSWTLGSVAGVNTVSASATGLAGSPVVFSATGTAGVATTIAANSVTSQSATVANAVAAPPSVVVTDAGGNPVVGVSVTFALTAGGGSIDPVSPAVLVTDANGIATLTSWTLGTGAGSSNNTVTATSGVLTGSPVTFNATGTADVATAMAANSVTAQSGTVATPVGAPPSVLVSDTHGNPVPGHPVAFVVATGAGAIVPASPAVVVTNASGIATLTSWALGTAAGTTNNSVTASSAGLTGSPISFFASATADVATTITANSATSQSATVGNMVGAAPSVLISDTHGNPVSGTNVTFDVASGGGSIDPAGPTVIASDVNGIATLISWTLGTVAGIGNNSVTATAAGLVGSPVNFSATGTADVATTIAANSVTTQSATISTAVGAAPSVLVTDTYGNPVVGTGVTFTLTVSGTGGSISPVSPAVIATNALGIATLTTWTLGSAAGTDNNTVTATSGVLAGSPVTFNASGTAGAATTIAANSSVNQSATVANMVAAAPSVLVTDGGGNPVSGVNVTFDVASGGGTIDPAGPAVIATDVNGIATLTSWTLGTAAGIGNNSVTATSGMLAGSPVTFLATATADVATTIAASSVTSQSVAVSTTAIPPSVLVTDTHGNPVLGESVTFTLTADGTGGSINPASPAVIATNALGIATLTTWTLGSAAGTDNNTVTATSGVLAGSPVTFNASGIAGAATTIAANSSVNQSATVANMVAAAPSVLVTDGGGNPVSGVNVTFAVASGGGVIDPAGPAVIATDVNGIATLTSWTLGTVAGIGNNSVTATSGVLAGSPVTFLATATADVATTIAANSVTTQSVAVSTTAIPPSVLVTDTHGNPVLGESVTFTLTADGTGGSIAPASPAIVATDALGIATLTTWTLGSDVGADNNTVTAASGALAGSPVTFNASGVAGAATTIAANSSVNQSATVANMVAAAPSVLVTDGSGNPVSGVDVTFAIASGGGTIDPAGPAVIATDVNGIATLTSWTLGTAAGIGNNSVTATSGVLAGSPVTFLATGTADVATMIAANSVTTQSVAVSTTATPPSVLVTDTHGNPVLGESVTFTLTADGTGGSIAPASPAIVATDALGIATLTTWTLGSDVGTDNNTVTATSGVLAGSPVTFNASGTAGAATTIAANSSVNQSATVANMVAAAPSVLVTDGGGNPVSGISVTFAVASGGGTIDPAGPAVIATDVNGIATLTSWTLGTAAGIGNNSVTATSGVLAGSPVTFLATATADVATTIAANSVTTQSGTVSTAGVPPSVLVTDTHGNPVSGASVTFALTADGTGGSIAPVSPAIIATDALGVATLTTWTLGSDVGTDNNTVTATSGVLAGSPVTFNASGIAGAATTIAANSSVNQSATVANMVAAAPSVLVTDGGGNPVSGVNVTFDVASGGGSIDPAGPTVIATDVNGIATLTSWTLGTAAGVGNNSVTATSGVLTGSPVTFLATATADVATTIAANSATTQSATVSTAAGAPPSVLVTDTHGNPVSGESVTFALTADGNGGTIAPASPAMIVTDAFGIATLTTWTLGSDVGSDNNTVTATSGVLAGSPVTFNASGTAEEATSFAFREPRPIGEGVNAAFRSQLAGLLQLRR